MNSKKNCRFCDIPSTLLLKNFLFCRLSINGLQNSSQALLLTPKRHVTCLQELRWYEFLEFILLWGIYYKRSMYRFRSPVGNMILNQGGPAGQTEEHLHAHIFIRGNEKEGEIENMKRTVRHPATPEEIFLIRRKCSTL